MTNEKTQTHKNEVIFHIQIKYHIHLDREAIAKMTRDFINHSTMLRAIQTLISSLLIVYHTQNLARSNTLNKEVRILPERELS
jgi:hypothetical protein